MSTDLRELTIQVCERVMGWLPILNGMTHGKLQLVFRDPEGGDRSIECGCVEDFNPAINVSNAFEVIEKMRELGAGTTIHIPQHADGAARVEMNVPSSECQEWGDSMPEAICKCALKAVEKFELRK